MKKPPGTETVSTGVVTALRSRSVFDQIVFARSEFSGREKGEDVLGDYIISGRDANTLQPQRFNFVPSVDERCYGYAMPMSQQRRPDPSGRQRGAGLYGRVCCLS